jgi:hypothetical protein
MKGLYLADASFRFTDKMPVTVDLTTCFRLRKGYYPKVSGLLSGCRFP